MRNGWIKLHRKLLENPIVKKHGYLALWIILLLRASHEERKVMWNGEILIIKEGEILAGRKELAEQSGIPETTIERILDFLENEHQIGQQKTNKFRIITILNWKEYQNRTAERTTNGQQTDTVKNIKNYKNNSVCKTFTSSKGKEINLEVAADYIPDGFSPLQAKQARKLMERELGKNKTSKWSQLLFGSAWDFIRAYQNFQGQDYVGDIIVGEVARNLSKWYEAGETRETIQEMILAFFGSEKAEKVTITPTSVFSTHTYNSWKQDKLAKTSKTKKWL